MGLLVSTRAAVLGCSTGDGDRTYLMLRAALRSLKGTLRMGRSPRMMAGTSPRFGHMLDRRQIPARDLRVDRHAQHEQDQQDTEEDGAGLQAAAEARQRLPLGSWKTKERWLSGTVPQHPCSEFPRPARL
jgi:hypothetical protein